MSRLSNDRTAQSSTSDWTLRSPLTPNNRSLSNGHAPATSLRILPSRSSSSHTIGISNMFNRVKPFTNASNTAGAASETANRTSLITTDDPEPNANQRGNHLCLHHRHRVTGVIDDRRRCHCALVAREVSKKIVKGWMRVR